MVELHLLEPTTASDGGETKGKTLTDTVTEAPVVEEPKEPKFESELDSMNFKMISDLIAKRNGLVATANAAHGDRQTLTEQIRENDQDPEIVNAREQMSLWSEKLNELVKPKVEKIIADASGSVEETEKEISEVDTKLKPALTFYKKAFDEGNLAFLPKQDRLSSSTTIRSGSSSRRIRGFAVEVTLDGKTTAFENFTQAAKHLDVETSDLQTAFFAKAGTENLKDIPDEVTMNVEYVRTDADGNSETLDATVRAYRTEPTAKAEAPAESADSAPVVDDETAENPFAADEDE